MDVGRRPPHFVLIPFMTPGHIIPMFDFAHLLAHRGALVSFVTTPHNASRIADAIARARDRALRISLVELPFPGEDEGLPPGLENFDALNPALAINFFRATYRLRRPLELHLQQHLPLPSAIISDFCHPWTREVADSLRIPRLTFYAMPCFAILCTLNIRRHKVFDKITDPNEPFAVPGLAEKIEVTQMQAPGFFPGPEFVKISSDEVEAELSADCVVFNTFWELERPYLELYQEAMGKKVWCVGPVSALPGRSPADAATRGGRASIDAERCLSWLDGMAPRSVVYVCFGSLTRQVFSQLVKIGLGLEASGHPFVWVIRSSDDAEKFQEWLSEGFEERMNSKALIIKGWAPQVLILSHPAIGGIVTHCGWNTIIETITAGLPMVTWPHFTDQFLDERFIVDVLRVGVSIGVQVPNFIGTQMTTLVKRDSVERCVRRLMSSGEEGEERRKRAWELREKAKVTLKEGGSSYSSLEHLINYFSMSRSRQVYLCFLHIIIYT